MWLVQHTTSPEEIKNLLAISDHDLAACQVKQLPSDWRCMMPIHHFLLALTRLSIGVLPPCFVIMATYDQPQKRAFLGPGLANKRRSDGSPVGSVLG